MTTHNTHHEQNDVDASVVENPPAPENILENGTVADLSASEAAEHPEEIATPAAEVTSSSDESTNASLLHEETSEGVSKEQPEQLTIDSVSAATTPDATDENASPKDTDKENDGDLLPSVPTATTQEETSPAAVQPEQQVAAASTHTEEVTASEAQAETSTQPEQSAVVASTEQPAPEAAQASTDEQVPAATAASEETAASSVAPEAEQPAAAESIVEVEQTADEPAVAPIVEIEQSADAHDKPAPFSWNEPFFTLDPVMAIPASRSSLTEPQAKSEPVSSDETAAAPEAASGVEEHEGVAAGEATASAAVSEDATPAALSEEKAEEVRPFTDFIAEFRQAEAARGNEVGVLSILSDLVVNEKQPAAHGETGASNEVVEDTTSNEVPADEHVAHGRSGHKKSGKEEIMKAADETEEKHETDEHVSHQVVDIHPVARPVSPLLRPPTRLRMPRHSLSRHLREEMQPAAPVENQAGAALESSKADANAATVSETPAEPPVTRPARRYRFDRPAASHITRDSVSSRSTTSGFVSALHTPSVSAQSSTTEASQQKSEEKQTPSVAQSHAEETKHVANGQQSNTHDNSNSGQQASESQSKKRASAQESENITENASASQVVEHGTSSRRRHSKEKEQQAAAAQVQESAPSDETPVSEQSKQAEPVAPEDLPPLEYAELQKASTRRRRRHRSSASTPAASNVTNSPTMNSTSMNNSNNVPSPVVTPAPTPATPPVRSPLPAANPAASINPYSIVSGYTLNQMNQQGSELSGPFMGPDPSPARGSVLMRDGRNTRAEARPTTPIYPGSRSTEGGLSTAAMTQFANIVSQALQQQTDRMVAEFRRMNQAPTNVSVTLPPFPSTERVGVFVDVANLLYSARTLRMTVHFGKLLDFLRGNRRLVRAHAYCPTSPQAGEEQMFLQAVKGLGYRITTKNYKTFSSGAKKADLDLDLCMDVVRLVDGGAVDCVVLVSGDSDFMPMLDYCSDHGVRVEVAAFDEAMSATLRQSCDLFINLSMLLDDIRG